MRPATVCIFLALLAGIFTGCGSEGAPLPPSLDLPEPVQDLRATRKGDKVTLAWTQPNQTTDHAAAERHIGESLICQSITDSPGQPLTACNQTVDRVAPKLAGQKTTATTVEAVVPISSSLYTTHPLSFAQYALLVNNHSGRNAGISNSASVPLAPTLPAPANLKIAVRADGVAISATAPHETLLEAQGRLQYIYRIDRVLAEKPQPGATAPPAAKVAEVPASEDINVIDHGFEWEKTYAYSITPVTRILVAPGGATLGEVEGETSAGIEVVTHDIFPPVAPVGLQAVYSGNQQQNFIDLTWAPNTEGDLAGYNVYRREEGGTFKRVNSELVKTPVFRDPDVRSGKQYFYYVTAVDLRNNESGNSEEAHEAVPAP